MSDFQARVVEAAVRDLSLNAELRLSSADLVIKRFTATEDEAAAMIARWEKADGHKRMIWYTGLWLAAIVASGAMWLMSFDDFSRYAQWGKWVAGWSLFTPLPNAPAERVSAKLNKNEKLLLFGDLTRTSQVERKEALWRSQPDNPAYFAEFSGTYVGEHSVLPPDFPEVARRIDPENSWFTYLAAAVEAKDAVKKNKRSGKRVAGKMVYNEPTSWAILDRARFDRSIELFREGLAQPKYNDYGNELLKLRLQLLPKDTLLDSFDSSTCLASTSSMNSIRLRILGDVVAAKAWRLGEAGDVQGLEKWLADGDRFLRKICSPKNKTMVDELVDSTIAVGVATSFSDAGEKLGLGETSRHWKAVADGLTRRKDGRDVRVFTVDGKPVESGTSAGGFHGGSMEMMARQAENQPPVTDADLKPMRMVEHELASWCLGFVTWIIMTVGLGFVAAYRFRTAAVSRQLARRVELLLLPSDWAWIVLGGTLLPLVFVMAVNYLTPLGGRAFGITGTALLLPAGHFIGLWILWLTLPVQIVKCRLAKRAGGLGFSSPSWTGWLAVACAAAFVLVLGWAGISHSYPEIWLKWIEAARMSMAAASGDDRVFWLAVGLAFLPAVWLVVAISRALLSGHRELDRMTTSLALIKFHAAVLVAVALVTTGFKISQQYWFTKDRMMKFDLTGAGWSHYETQVAVQMQRELREVLGYKP